MDELIAVAERWSSVVEALAVPRRVPPAERDKAVAGITRVCRRIGDAIEDGGAAAPRPVGRGAGIGGLDRRVRPSGAHLGHRHRPTGDGRRRHDPRARHVAPGGRPRRRDGRRLRAGSVTGDATDARSHFRAESCDRPDGMTMPTF